MNYKDSIFLPHTSFPMRANLPEREPVILAEWERKDIYHKRCSMSDKKKRFTLHDGPPFANGVPHAGTSLNRVLKDIILRMKWMQGYYAPFIPGWDCHGLPIEWKVVESLKTSNSGDVSVNELREMCASFAKHWIRVQKTGFKRLGTLGDWDNPYLTMSKHAEATVAKLLGKFLLDGSIYSGEKPVYWSVVEQTALADAEIEYASKVSTSLYVLFGVDSTDIDVLRNTYIVIWTTTPWTIPANRAISYSRDAIYVVVDVVGDRKYVVAADRLHNFMPLLGCVDYEVIAEVVGHELCNTVCRHPLFRSGYSFKVPMIEGEHVTLDTGTGFVHTAPGHGVDDYNVCKKYGIPVPKVITPDGHYCEDVPLFAGKHIFKDESVVIDALDEENSVLVKSKITHSYPHSWRSKSPLIFMTTPQWFINLDNSNLRKQVLDEIKRVEWLPSQGYQRIKSFIENRGDWCISRQRSWGTPLPIFVNKSTLEPLRDENVINRIVDIFEKEGASAWYSRKAEDFLGDEYNPDDYIQSMDIVDVWFESSSSSVFVLQDSDELDDVADLYLEGSDQHRGWFQHSILVGCKINGRAPFKSVLTHGFVTDERGYKMSKSLGNTVDLPALIDKVGADIFRLWVAGSDFTGDLRLGDNILKQHQENYKKIRNTLRYMLGVLCKSEVKDMPYDDLPVLEKYILHSMYVLNEELMQTVNRYDINLYLGKIINFCTNELSSFFFDIRKDRLYCDSVSDKRRMSYLFVLKNVFNYVVRWIAPILVFTSDEAWCTLYGSDCSVHLQYYLQPSELWKNEQVASTMNLIKDIRKQINDKLELARQQKIIGSSLEASVILKTNKYAELQELSGILEEVCIASRVVVEKGSDELDVIVEKFDGTKCERCWKFFDTNGKDLCERCMSILNS